MPGETATPVSHRLSQLARGLARNPLDDARADTIARHSKDHLPSDASHTTAVNASHTSWFGGIIGDSLFLLFATEQTPKRCSYVAAVDPKENKQLP